MALATVAELAVRVPGGIELVDEPRAQALLDDVSTMVRAKTGLALTDEPYPAVAVAVTLSVATRAWLNPEGLSSIRAGAYAETVATPRPGLWFNSTELDMLATLGASTDLWVQPMGRVDDTDTTVYVAVDYGGDPVPLYNDWR